MHAATLSRRRRDCHPAETGHYESHMRPGGEDACCDLGQPYKVPLMSSGAPAIAVQAGHSLAAPCDGHSEPPPAPRRSDPLPHRRPISKHTVPPPRHPNPHDRLQPLNPVATLYSLLERKPAKQPRLRDTAEAGDSDPAAARDKAGREAAGERARGDGKSAGTLLDQSPLGWQRSIQPKFSRGGALQESEVDHPAGTTKIACTDSPRTPRSNSSSGNTQFAPAVAPFYRRPDPPGAAQI